MRNYEDGEQEITNEITGETTTNYLSDEEYVNIFYPRRNRDKSSCCNLI